MTPASSLLLIPVLGLVSGILCGRAGMDFAVAGIMILTAIIIYWIINRLSENPVRGFTLNRLHYVWVFLLFSAIGVSVYNLDKPFTPDGRESDLLYAEGRIEDVAATTYGDRLIVDVGSVYTENKERISTPRFKVLLRTDATDYDIDDRILFPLELKPISDNANYFNTGYADFLRNRGICYESRCNSEEMAFVRHETTLKGRGIKIRRSLETFIEKSPLSRYSSNFLITILLGDRSFLDSDTRDVFADAGISHILALSGMHVGIIAAIILVILFPINFTGHYKVRLAICPLILLFYAFITGWSPSTLRAILMMTAILIGLLLERKNNAWNALLFATLIILLVNPFALWDAGYQMSFVCVAALFFFANSLNPVSRHDRPKTFRVVSLFLTTIVATLATWSLTAYYFGRLPVMFLPANIIVLPLLPVYLSLSLLYLVLFSFGVDFAPLRFIVEKGPEALHSFLSWLTAEGSTSLDISISGLTAGLWLLFLISLAFFINGNRKKLWGCLSSSVAVLFVCSAIITDGRMPDNGFIIQNNPTSLKLLTRTSGQDRLHTIPARANTLFKHSDMDILFLDCDDMALLNRNLRPDIIVISKGVKNGIGEILETLKPAKVVIHTSVRKKKEANVREMADSLGIAVHSIRYDGPYRHQD